MLRCAPDPVVGIGVASVRSDQFGLGQGVCRVVFPHSRPRSHFSPLPLATPPPPLTVKHHTNPRHANALPVGRRVCAALALVTAAAASVAASPPPHEAAPRPSLRSHHSAAPAFRSSPCSPRPHAGVEPTQGLRVQGILALARPRGGEALPIHPGQCGGRGEGGVGRGGGGEVASVMEAGGEGGRHGG